jgi:hypothetical protein
VQRDAPDANRGRSFARFETRFQLIWVAGAVLGIIPMPTWVGFLLVSGIAAFAAVSYTAGSRGARRITERRSERAGRGGDLGFLPGPVAELPPTIVTPAGPAAEPPEPPPEPPAPIPPSIATPDQTRPGPGDVDPTAVDRAGEGTGGEQDPA